MADGGARIMVMRSQIAASDYSAYCSTVVRTTRLDLSTGLNKIQSCFTKICEFSFVVPSKRRHKLTINHTPQNKHVITTTPIPRSLHQLSNHINGS